MSVGTTCPHVSELAAKMLMSERHSHADVKHDPLERMIPPSRS